MYHMGLLKPHAISAILFIYIKQKNSIWLIVVYIIDQSKNANSVISYEFICS